MKIVAIKCSAINCRNIHCVTKKCTTFETILLEIVRTDFEDIWLKTLVIYPEQVH